MGDSRNETTKLLIARLQVRFLSGSSASKEPFDMPIERFLASLRFENRDKLDDLGIEIDSDTLKVNV